MSQLIPITVEVRGKDTLITPVVEMIQPENIEFVQPESTDVFTDRAMLQYYDLQRDIIIPYVTTETVDAIKTLANNASTDDILIYQVVSTFNDKHLAKLCLVNVNKIVNTEPVLTGAKPVTEWYDYGERNHVMNYKLDVCSYPLSVVSVDPSPVNSFTLACCVDNFFSEGTSITVGGSPFTVISTACTSDGGVVYVEEDVSGINVGDEVSLT